MHRRILVLAFGLAALVASQSVDAGTPMPTVHRTEKGDAASLELGRRAPASIYFLFGEPPEEQDPETGEGGDGGGSEGGEGTGTADGVPEPNLDVLSADLTGDDTLVDLASFNASNLVDPGFPDLDPMPLARRVNTALVFSVDATTPGFATAPGYGNNWDQQVAWTRPVPNPSAPVVVRVRFVVNHDVEPPHDVFRLEVRREDGWQTVRELTGRNGGSTGGPAFVDEIFTLTPNDYPGPNGQAVDLRLRVLTDRAGSDEDGLWPSDGAAQVDQIRVWFDGQLVSAADFEGSPPRSDGWQPQVSGAAGSFLKILTYTQDLDPCRRNVTHQYTFIDDGTPPVGSTQSTGGSISPNWNYGPGGFTLNYTGGVSEGGDTPIHDALRTPPFAWDLPGTEDDGSTGALLLFSVWKHLPLENGIFYFWRVRSHSPGNGWSPWRDFDEVYYEPSAPHYERVEVDVSSLIRADPDSAQFELGVIDLADALGLPGDDATPSPSFDNIGFAKYPIDGPAIRIADAERFHSAFPTSGTSDYEGDLASHAIRIDAARDIVDGPQIVPGDSMVVRVRPSVPGVGLDGPPKLVWALRANPRYQTVRVLPAGAVVALSVPTTCGPPEVVYTGEIDGQPVVTSTGRSVADLWSFDLPDGPGRASWHANEAPFLFPGDELRWFVEARDRQNNVATAPEDTTGFFRLAAGAPRSDRGDLVLGLPSLDAAANHPPILVVDDTGSLERGAAIDVAFDETGRRRGCDFDLYRVRAAAAGLSNGIGSAAGHGALPDQIEGYDTIVYFAGDQGAFLLSDGSGDPLNDDGDDLGLLSAWKQLRGPRRVIHFGDDLVSGLRDASAAGISYVDDELAVALLADDVRPRIGNQTAPRVDPISTSFVESFVAGGCFSSDQFDAIIPLAASTAVRTHEFLDPNGSGGAYSDAAVVWHARTTPLGGHVDVIVPISFSAILEPTLPRTIDTARARVLDEFLGQLDAPISTDTPSAALNVARLEAPHPNPFNPRTSIEYAVPRDARVRLRVVDLAGRLVATLVDEVRVAGSHQVVWNGTDDRGAAVASGVYLVDFRADGARERRKVALIR